MCIRDSGIVTVAICITAAVLVSRAKKKAAAAQFVPETETYSEASLSMIAKAGLVFKTAEKRFTQKQVQNMSIKCREIGQDVRDLSGGNKQKVVFGKWLGNESQIFILDCPTRGIDIGVKDFMYQLMYQLKEEGKSILMP